MFKKFLVLGLVLGIMPFAACSGNGGGEPASEKPSASAAADLPMAPKKPYDLDEIYDGENGLAFDIFYPTAAIYEKSPLVVAFHGGGWVAGDKSQIMYIFAPIVEDLLKNGYAVATVQYRFAQAAAFPAQLRDCANAIQHMADNAEKYNIDTNSIGVMGYSAGAQLAMLLSYVPARSGLPLYGREYSFDIKHCVSFAGPSKLYGAELEEYSGNIKYLLEWLFGGEYEKKESEYISGSPYFYITGETKKTPLLLAHDEADGVVPFSQSRAMQKKALEEKIPCELLALSGFGHQIDFASPYMDPKSGAAIEAILGFIYENSGSRQASAQN